LRRVRFTPEQLKEGIKLNLGCGIAKMDGFVNLDKVDVGQEILWDLEEGIPLPDDSVVEVYAKQTLEHIHNIILVMNEIWRVCKDGVMVYITVPHSETPQAWQDPTHVRAFNEYSWGYFIKGNHTHLRDLYGIRCNFEVVKMERRNWSLIVFLRVVKEE